MSALFSPLAALAAEPLSLPEAQSDPAAYQAYWHAGKAELTRYTLEQARYGHLHKGEALNIFVTEDFLADRQVKSDYDTNEPALPVLKLNALRTFNTGIYSYSLMSSVFTPVDFALHPRTLKVTTSVQDWCGQTWTQLNLKNGNYRVELRSYFAVEGDKDTTIPAVWLEEELWTRLRLAPGSLPVGNEIEIVPARIHTRFYKAPEIAQKAEATLEALEQSPFHDAPHAVYRLRYKDIQRRLAIYFEPRFPYSILGWEETGAGVDEALVTTAKRAETLMTDYWSHHDPSDLPLRKELGFSE